jgi:hypothetical protein
MSSLVERRDFRNTFSAVLNILDVAVALWMWAIGMGVSAGANASTGTASVPTGGSRLGSPHLQRLERYQWSFDVGNLGGLCLLWYW